MSDDFTPDLPEDEGTPDLPAGPTSRIINRLIEDEMRESFIDYSMSVIVQRALPDVRDGLKPVHRRILYAMSEAGLIPTRPYKKCATVVGDVLGKYHPHGDSSVYDALVRMVQDFSLRYPLVDGQGNFGSIDGDAAAAYRYTESRMAPLALELLADIDKDTVDFAPNYDDRLTEPRVLPAKVPNLLINGSSGIAVGMATNIPPHNLREVVAACVHLIDNPDATWEDLHQFVRGPDFPTGGIIYGRDGFRGAYEHGRGRVVLRARAEIEEKDGGRGERIIITEVPFQVNKSRLIEHIAELVRDKKIEGISDLRDESDRNIRVVIDLKRDAIPHIVLNQLFKHTQLQSTFGIIMLSLVGGVPKVMGLREMLQHFVQHRHVVVRRRAEFELRKAREREHILEGLKIAVDNIDEVIAIIRGSETTAEAGESLRGRFGLSERQSDAILNMRLARLTGLEIEQLESELADVRATIADLEDILANVERRKSIIKDELTEVSDKFGDERRTDILGDAGSLSIEDLIPDEEMVITVSHAGYIKRVPSDTYRAQARGGRGIEGMKTKEEDWVEHLFLANTHDYLMFFTRDGQCYWLKVHEVPVGSRNSRGKPVVNLINMGGDEKIAALVPVRTFAHDKSLIFATRNGVVKKTSLAAYGNPRRVGINAMNVLDGDELISVQLADGNCDVVLATRDGMAIRFEESDAREMGRATTGVRGISLRKGDLVIGMVVTKAGSTLLVMTEKGMGKRTPVEDYRRQNRGGMGVINVKTSDKTGRVVAMKEVHPGDELMVITREGIIIRTPVDGIRVIGRNTQGVKIINLGSKDSVMDVARVVNEDEEPLPILDATESTGQEVVDSVALEETLGIDPDFDDDDGGVSLDTPADDEPEEDSLDELRADDDF
ncbi:DNA gyrase subunit A [Longimicrobium terrae]|uniref:DNA gyrase subunit A n=1 Tax=Longimicrobium terrae TaxID=1639882 RepID=A0A841GYH6_9BACT|nr:DNA gyrase subunit A [Longimicrobium terrae]MBB4636645.1 DNA gyrase subunit A [Longimicrobium terrae]MBB6070831.1 DNA gyrase subunit A [Longimicrobium terrae]NNC28857.1 DNA gyrase subunit A [Longimicrobium terrae]